MDTDSYSVLYYAEQIKLGNITIMDVPSFYKSDVRIVLKGWGIDV
jgi:hypothetical protein